MEEDTLFQIAGKNRSLSSYTGMEKEVSRIKASGSSASTMGLVCHYQFKNGSSQFIFLHIDQESGALCIDHPLSFHTKSDVQIVCSSHGLLLLSSRHKKRQKYHVFNPLTEVSVTLPPPSIDGKIIGSGLAFDGHQFRVVLVHITHTSTKSTDYPELEIFSSKTGTWKRHCRTNLALPLPVPETEVPAKKPGKLTDRVIVWLHQRLRIKSLFHRSRRGKEKKRYAKLCCAATGSGLGGGQKETEPCKRRTAPVFSNGAIHWKIGDNLLVYHVKVDYCELIELPSLPCDFRGLPMVAYRSCLWEAEGRLQYSYTDKSGIHTWDLLNEQDHKYYSNYSVYDREKYRWRLAQSVDHQHLVTKQPQPKKFFNLNNWKPYHISPFACIEASQTMYLQLPGTVVSYNISTEVLKQVCTYELERTNLYSCSFFPFIHAGHSITSKFEAVPVSLPIAESVKSVSF